MQRKTRQSWIAGLILSSLWPLASHAEKLSLEAYLDQVKTKHEGVQGSLLGRDGAQLRSQESTLLVRPNLLGNVQLSRDDKDNYFTSLSSLRANTYSLGVAQQTTFGLQAKLSYDITYNSYTLLSGVSGSQHLAQPSLTLSQSLWRNSFGSETRAQIEASEASAMATSFAESYRARVIVAQAEGAYWNLSLARSAVKITRELLDRAQKLYDWSANRVRLNLADQSDKLQSEALLKLRSLELRSALDNERVASRNFNQYRGIDSDVAADEVETLTSGSQVNVRIPARAAMREDVKAAEQQEFAVIASSKLGQERVTPNLEVYGAVGLAGQDPSLNTAVSHSVTLAQKAAAVGVRLTMPLDFGLVSETKRGYALEQVAASKNFRRKVFDQDNDWNDLTQRLEEARGRLELAIQLEKVQLEKLRSERERLTRGRTTTFQVIQFEQDYSQSQLNTIRSQAEVLQILAQMKVFGGPL